MTNNKKQSNRLFASFYNQEHLDEQFDALVKKMPKKYRFDLAVYIGQLESTWVEGFEENNNEK